MEVRMAEHYGMCFGVRDAIDLALELTRRGSLTILGDLVHNPDVIAQMDEAGAKRVHWPEQVATTDVLLTAHGTSKHVRHQLQMAGHQLHDAVCPLVTRAHIAGAKLIAEGRHLVVIGQADHVEVRGLIGDLTEFTVILEEVEIEKLAGHTKLGIVSQTTQPVDHVRRLIAAIQRQFPYAEVRAIDTVCQPTKDRQTALHQLIAECDAVVVVGGTASNNSRKLTELASSRGRRAFQVARASELRREWFADVHVVGITAGTSTPETTVQEVRAWLETLGND